MVVTSVKIFTPPLDIRVIGLLSISTLTTLLTSLSAMRLAKRHLQKGQRITGALNPGSKAVSAMNFILLLPVFGLVSYISLLCIELRSLWAFVEVCVLANAFSQISVAYTNIVGGALKYQLHLKERIANAATGTEGGNIHKAIASWLWCSESETTLEEQPVLEELQLYGHPPCCCIKPCVGKPRIPTMADLPTLRCGILQFSLLQPLLAFLSLLGDLELQMGAPELAYVILKSPFLNILKVISNLVCQSSVKGLKVLVCAGTPIGNADKRLDAVKSYCSTFMICAQLLPLLLSGIFAPILNSQSKTLTNGMVLSELEYHHIINAACTNVGLLFCLRKCWKAFPADESTYPELKEGCLEKESKLRHIGYCPFCGSHDLTSDPELGNDSAFCSHCSTSGIPIELEVRC